ncbi:MAG: alpha/beta hydrolase [Chitinophagales bacterium]|nr:alpha/beta hydrolase [Chitinophagales bacterium]
MKKYIFIGLIVLIFGGLWYLYQPPIPLEELKKEYTDEYSHFIKLNGLDVHYKKKGNGFSILLIHGTSSSLHTWEQWEQYLSKNYTTYSIDMQGGGLTSPALNNEYSIQAYLDLLDAFVEELNIDSFYLVGNSLGGHTAWAYAANAKYADRVKKLVLVDPSGFFDKNREKPLVFKLAKYNFLLNNAEYINTNSFVKRSLKEVFYNDDLITPQIVKRYTDLGRRPGNRQAFFYKVQQMEAGKESDLHKIKCPTLIQWGREDAWIPLSLSDIFVANIPNNKLIIYENCGHIPMEEIPEKSVTDVINFFEE